MSLSLRRWSSNTNIGLFAISFTCLGRRDGVDDLVQETWLRVLERGSSYDGHSRFEPWLFRVARNIAVDAMRKRRIFSLDSNDEDGCSPIACLQ